jgi:hypothetical protein
MSRTKKLALQGRNKAIVSSIKGKLKNLRQEFWVKRPPWRIPAAEFRLFRRKVDAANVERDKVARKYKDFLDIAYKAKFINKILYKK